MAAEHLIARGRRRLVFLGAREEVRQVRERLRGVHVPDDLAVVGHDDIDFARVAAVPLTSIRLRARGMGRRAGELLLEQIGGDSERKTVVYAPELVVRASTGGEQ